MNDKLDISALRRDYEWVPLHKADLDPDPIVSFRSWLEEAVAAGVNDANTMVLATADAAGVPSARSVLLKDVDGRGFTFYSNRTSRKGADLAANPRAALVFRWVQLERQVTVSGPVSDVGEDEADAYFASRPRANQLGAWASRQSQVVPDRSTIDGWVASASDRFRDGPIPRPPFWGGYRVVPLSIEFWQGRPDRLHDRIRYRRDDGGPAEPWLVERLSP